MDWRAWASVVAGSMRGVKSRGQGRRWTMQGQSFLLNPVRSRRGRARNYLALAQRCSARGGPSVLGVEEWKHQGFGWRKLGDTSIHGQVHVGPCLPRHWLPCVYCLPRASNPQVRPALPCPAVPHPSQPPDHPIKHMLHLPPLPRSLASPIVPLEPFSSPMALPFSDPLPPHCRGGPMTPPLPTSPQKIIPPITPQRLITAARNPNPLRLQPERPPATPSPESRHPKEPET